MIQNNLNAWYPLDNALVELINILYNVMTTDSITDYDINAKKRANARIKVLLQGNLDICMYIHTDSSVRLLKFAGVYVNGRLESDVTRIHDAMTSKTSVCEFRWTDIYPHSIEYSRIMTDIIEVREWLKSLPGLKHRESFADYMYMVSILMGVHAMIQLISLIFQDVNPLVLDGNVIGNSTIPDEIFLPYLLTMRQYVNHCSIKLHRSIGTLMGRGEDNIVKEYWFCVDQCIKLTTSEFRTHSNKFTPNASIYEVSLASNNSIFQAIKVHDIPHDDLDDIKEQWEQTEQDWDEWEYECPPSL